MTLTAAAPAQIELAQGDLAVVPVPEGRVVLRNEQKGGGTGRVESVILLLPHGDAEPYELVRYSHNNYEPSAMLTLALTALDSWR